LLKYCDSLFAIVAEVSASDIASS